MVDLVSLKNQIWIILLIFVELEGKYPKISFIVSTDTSSSLKEADIIVAATNTSSPLFNGSDLPNGVHINGIGSYTYDSFFKRKFLFK